VIWPDYAILASILISILVGVLRGFVKEVFSLLIWALAFFVAYQYGGNLAVLMEDHVALPSARAVMGFAGLFIAVLLIGGLVNYLVGRLVESTGLSGTDRLLGGAFGAARGLAIVTVLLLAMGFTPLPADPWWKESALIHRLQPLLEWSAAMLPENLREHLDFSPEPVDPSDSQNDSNGGGGEKGLDQAAGKERAPT
jgi:membrane protein required for colicin V production